eukprot:Ihof_evm8s104 gene=Ihof_evmTU8s104
MSMLSLLTFFIIIGVSVAVLLENANVSVVTLLENTKNAELLVKLESADTEATAKTGPDNLSSEISKPSFVCIGGPAKTYHCAKQCAAHYWLCPALQPGATPTLKPLAPGVRCPCDQNVNCVRPGGDTVWQVYENQCKTGFYDPNAPAFPPKPKAVQATPGPQGRINETTTATGTNPATGGDNPYLQRLVDCLKVEGCKESPDDIVLKFGIDMIKPYFFSMFAVQTHHPADSNFMLGLDKPHLLLEQPTQNGYYEFCLCFPKNFVDGPQFKILAVNGTTPSITPSTAPKHEYPYKSVVDAVWAINFQNYIYLGKPDRYVAGCCGFQTPLIGQSFIQEG